MTKFLVYNARKRQPGGDRAEAYFERTECVAGVQDMRFQELMPDVLHWLGITRIDRLVSMSNMKYAPIVASGIEVVERVPIPDGLIPPDAQVEMDAKKAAGYFTDERAGRRRAAASRRAAGWRSERQRRPAAGGHWCRPPAGAAQADPAAAQGDGDRRFPPHHARAQPAARL